ncbi:MAG: WXG100 family type VII secretion target [Lachnospiraceae bacterium]|nr:WXG100 family type VII secretion target [Lachnospiraceae bacterium]
MGSGVIQVDADLLREKAGEVARIKEDLDNAITRLTTFVDWLNAICKGEAQESHYNRFHSMKSTLDTFSQRLEEYAELMNMSADKMEAKDIESQQTIDSTLGSIQ